MDEESEHVKEVYARFGFAVYQAQVLEHGIVNALVLLDLIPSRRHLARSAEEWGSAVDNFMSRNFEKTMGRMIKDLKTVASVPGDLEEMLTIALTKRNWLAHDFFREHAEDFMNASGRDRMIAEAGQCREIFVAADQRLFEVTTPLRIASGLTDEMLAKEYNSMRAEAERAG